jgi:hypothetical protein
MDNLVHLTMKVIAICVKTHELYIFLNVLVLNANASRLEMSYYQG